MRPLDSVLHTEAPAPDSLSPADRWEPDVFRLEQRESVALPLRGWSTTVPFVLIVQEENRFSTLLLVLRETASRDLFEAKLLWTLLGGGARPLAFEPGGKGEGGGSGPPFARFFMKGYDGRGGSKMFSCFTPPFSFFANAMHLRIHSLSPVRLPNSELGSLETGLGSSDACSRMEMRKCRPAPRSDSMVYRSGWEERDGGDKDLISLMSNLAVDGERPLEAAAIATAAARPLPP